MYALAAKYGLTILIPYDMANPPYIPFDGGLGPHNINARTSPLREYELGYVFDTRYPLQRQLASLATEFARRDAQRDAARIRPKVLARYLRVLDACETGARHKDIAAHLIADGTYSNDAMHKFYPGDAMLEKDLSHARRLVNGDYLRIAHS